MSISKQIIEALEEIKEPSIFEKYRAILKENKKLKRNDWLNLRKLMKTDFIYDVIQLDLTPRETRLVGSVIKSISLENTSEVLAAILRRRNPYLLEALLHKNKKFDVSSVQPYLIEMVGLKEIRLIHLHLLQTVYKNYPFLIEETILDFCRNNPHDICQEILKGVESSSKLLE